MILRSRSCFPASDARFAGLRVQAFRRTIMSEDLLLENLGTAPDDRDDHRALEGPDWRRHPLSPTEERYRGSLHYERVGDTLWWRGIDLECGVR